MKKLAVLLAVALLSVAFVSNASAFTWATGPADIFLAGGLSVNTDGTEGDLLTSLADPFGGTISFTPAVTRSYVGSTWATWSHGYTGSVLQNLLNPSSIRLDFDGVVTAFGAYAEPNVFDNYDITLGLASGETMTKTVQGQAGADFFGFYDGAVNWVEFTTTDQSGMAIGEIEMAKTPEPGTLMLLGSGLLGLGFLRRRKQ